MNLPRLRRRIGLVSLALLIGAAGCAGTGPSETLFVLRWPEPPQVTRIENVGVIEAAFADPPSFWQTLGRVLGMSKADRGKRIVHPADVEVSPDGSTVYVSDFAQGLVHIFDLELRKTRYFGEREPLGRPLGLDLDSAGNLYVVEQVKQQIRLLDPAGRTQRIFQSDKLIRPVDVAVDEARGRLYVADGARQKTPEHYVRIFDLEGNYLGEIGQGKGSGEGYLLFPTYLTLDPDGNLYVADTMNARISVFDPAGQFLRQIGERGDGFGLFDKPKGVAIDSFGNVYVVDSSWSNVQIFGPEGHVLLFFGGRGGHPGLLRNPTGIAIAGESNTIIVGDYLNRRLCIYRLVNTKPEDGVPQENS